MLSCIATGQTYRVDEHHAFVLEAEELGHVAHIVLELLDEPADLAFLDLDDEGLGAVNAVRRDHQVAKKDEKKMRSAVFRRAGAPI